MLPADDDDLEPGSDVNAVVIPEPLSLVAGHLVLVECRAVVMQSSAMMKS